MSGNKVVAPVVIGKFRKGSIKAQVAETILKNIYPDKTSLEVGKDSVVLTSDPVLEVTLNNILKNCTKV